MKLSLQVETITTVEGLHALAPEWRILFEQSGIALPFYTFEWVDIWWKYLRQDRRAIRDHLQIRALRNAQGELIAVAPLILTERPATGVVRARFLQFIGADPNLTELRGMLVLPSYEKEAYLALMQDIQTAPWDWVLWSGLSETGADIVGAHLCDHHEPTPDFYLTLPETWAQFQEGLKRNIRESLRKCYNSLKRDNLVPELRVAVEAGEITPALERFIELHGARSADTTTSVRHANVFSQPEMCAFLHEVCQRFAAQNITHVFQLIISGEVVATRIGFQFGDTLYLYYSGYDPQWSKYSVMTTTAAEALKYAIAHGVKAVNLSTGRDVSKIRWGPAETIYRGGVQVASSGRSRMVYKAYRKGVSLRASPLARKIAGRLVR